MLLLEVELYDGQQHEWQVSKDTPYSDCLDVGGPHYLFFSYRNVRRTLAKVHLETEKSLIQSLTEILVVFLTEVSILSKNLVSTTHHLWTKWFWSTWTKSKFREWFWTYASYFNTQTTEAWRSPTFNTQLQQIKSLWISWCLSLSTHPAIHNSLNLLVPS